MPLQPLALQSSFADRAHPRAVRRRPPVAPHWCWGSSRRLESRWRMGPSAKVGRNAADHYGGRVRLAEGADILDVGGESTRPGAERPDPAEELRRVLPVVEALAADGAVVSIDTMRPDVAAKALDAGATAVNDVSGGLGDPLMLALIAERRAPYICMHWLGHSADMQTRAVYDDVVADHVRELGLRVEALDKAGVDLSRVALDPGLGFAKTAEHNWEILRRLDEFGSLGLPLLIGASRKAFLGKLLADASGEPRPAVGRAGASAAISALAAAAGVWCVRAHAVAPSVDAVRVARRWTADD